MPATNISPNVDNYFVGAGILKWKGVNDTDFRDCGNCSKFEFTITPTRLKHMSSRIGVRRVDKNVVTQIEAALALTLDELTAKNLAFALLGTEVDGTPVTLSIGELPDIEGQFRLVGTNDIGAKVQVDLVSCTVAPSGALGLINNGQWGEIQLTADVNTDPNNAASFGQLAWGITDEISYP